MFSPMRTPACRRFRTRASGSLPECESVQPRLRVRHPERVASELQVEGMPAVPDSHVATLQRFGKARAESHDIPGNLDSRRHALYQVGPAVHRTQGAPPAAAVLSC